MDSDIEMIVNFVEGKITSQEFESYLYQSKTMQSLLEQEESTSSFNLYYDLLEINYKTPSGASFAQKLLERYLNKLNISFNPTTQYELNYDLIHSASPTWLDIDPNFIHCHFLKNNPGATKKELRTWLLDKFKYLKSPPKWIHGCDWPIKNEEPLVFIGELEIKGGDYFHDITCFYLFFNPQTQECETVIQSF